MRREQITVWPDGIKCSPNYSKVAQKSRHNSFYFKSYVFKVAQKVAKYLDYFCLKIVAKKFQKSSNLVTLAEKRILAANCLRQRRWRSRRCRRRRQLGLGRSIENFSFSSDRLFSSGSSDRPVWPGEISPLWQNFKSLWPFFATLFSIWCNVKPTLANLLCLSAISLLPNGQISNKWCSHHLVTLTSVATMTRHNHSSFGQLEISKKVWTTKLSETSGIE